MDFLSVLYGMMIILIIILGIFQIPSWKTYLMQPYVLKNNDELKLAYKNYILSEKCEETTNLKTLLIALEQYLK